MLSSEYQATEVRTGYQSYKKGFIGEKKLHLHYSPFSSQCTENRKISHRNSVGLYVNVILLPFFGTL